MKIPLLSDLTHQISKDYGVYLEDQGHALRYHVNSFAFAFSFLMFHQPSLIIGPFLKKEKKLLWILQVCVFDAWLGLDLNESAGTIYCIWVE